MVKRLQQFIDTRKEIEDLKERIIRLEHSLYSPRVSDFSGMPRGGSHEPEHLTESLVALDQLKHKYEKLVSRLSKQQSEVEDAIETLDPTERELIRLRYFDGLTWSKVSAKLNYGQRQVFTIHKKILQKLKRVHTSA